MDRTHRPYLGPLVAKIVLGIALVATPYMAFAIDRPHPASPPQSGSSTKAKAVESESAALKEAIDGASSRTSTTY